MVRRLSAVAPRGGDIRHTMVLVALVPFARTVSPCDCLQALCHACEPIRNQCGPAVWRVRIVRWPTKAIFARPRHTVCKPLHIGLLSHLVSPPENTPCCSVALPSGLSNHAPERVIEGRPGHRSLGSWGLSIWQQGRATVRFHKMFDTRAHWGPVGCCTLHVEVPMSNGVDSTASKVSIGAKSPCCTAVSMAASTR